MKKLFPFFLAIVVLLSLIPSAYADAASSAAWDDLLLADLDVIPQISVFSAVPIPAFVSVGSTDLHIKKGPGSYYDTVSSVPSWESVNVYADLFGWALICYDGIWGWVESPYLIMDSSGSSPDAAATATAENPDPRPAQIDGSSYEITYQNVRVFDEYGYTKAIVMIEITNNGTKDLYLDICSYDLEDSAGSLIATESMVSCFPSVLSPGEKGYLYETSYLDDYSGDGNVVVLPHLSIEDATIKNTRYPVSDISITDDGYGGIKVLGRVENNTNETEDSPEVAVVFYDDNGTPLGLDYDLLLPSLAPGDKTGFEINYDDLPDGITAAQIADYTVYAYPAWQLQW